MTINGSISVGRTMSLTHSRHNFVPANDDSDDDYDGEGISKPPHNRRMKSVEFYVSLGAHQPA